MKWLLVFLSVASSTAGDVFSARGMKEHGEIDDFRPGALARLLGYIVRNGWVAAGIACNAISFVTFMGLLAVAELSFSVPATSASYVVKIALSRYWLNEHVDWHRWIGAVLVSIGIILISF